jgi:hypothetical protein
MGLFGKKVEMVTCPICGQEFNGRESGTKSAHWESHVQKIPPGQGEASGQYTWECSCGPCGMKWPKSWSAATALAIHMNRRHDISIDSPLDDGGLIVLEVERKLGIAGQPMWRR